MKLISAASRDAAKTATKRIEQKRGRGTKKTPVMVLVERGGEAVSKPIERVDASTLHTAIKETVDRKSTIMTDELKGYRGIGGDFAGGHQNVNHGLGEYVKGDVTTNTAESYFSLFKRGIHGRFHHISKQHLNRYCDEFGFAGITVKQTMGHGPNTP